MATRVNKKLLIIVLSCSAIAIGVVSAVAVQQWRQDPTRFLKAGDAAMARNDYREAARNYGRAIGKRPNELAFHSKYIDAAAKVVPASADEARESYLLWVGSLLKRAQIARNDEKLWREVLEERFFQSEVNESVAGWQAMHDVAALEMLEGLDPGDPLTWTAKAVMGYSQSRRYGALSPEEVTKTIALLESALEKAAGADRDLAYAGLLNIRFEQATRLERAGQARQAADSWKVFDDLYAKAASEVPDGFHLTELGLLRLRARMMSNDPAVRSEMLSTAADTLIQRAVALGTRSAIFETVKAVGSPAVPQGLEKAAAMLRDYLVKNPNEILHRRALAVCLEGFNIAEAEKEAQAIIEAAQLPVSLASAAQDETRVRAAQQIFDLDFERLFPTSGEALPEAQRLELIKKLEASSARIRELAKGLADDSPVLKTEGMVAFAKRDFNLADQKFKEVFRKGSLIDDLQLYVLASAVAEERGETGQAQQLVNKGLEKAPGSLLLLERNGRLALRNGRFAEAKNFAEQILAKEPENKQAQNLRRAAEEGEHPMMIDPNDPIIQQVKKADDLRTALKFDEARAVLDELLAKYPDNLPVLIVALSLEYDTKNNDKALELADRALKLSPGNANVTRLRSLIVGGEDPVARVVAQVSVERPNEPDRTIFTAIRLAQTEASVRQRVAAIETSDPPEAERLKGLLVGITSSAAEWRTKAAALDPLNPAWLDFLFSAALLEKKFDVAEQVITDAERSGRSPATVSLFRGRLALTQGRAGEAVALLQKSIDANVDDSDVFRLLGIAYEQSGDLQSALKNYAEAYRRKPTDLTPGKVYASALVRAGDRSNALSILRELRKIAPSDEDLMETWLDVEAEIGDRRLARSVRKARYDLVPGERRNSIKYATMMAEAQPEREDISDAAGRTKYTEAAWRALEDRARQQEIDRRRAEWQADSDRIYDKLIAAEPLSMELALIRAATYRRQGRVEQAEQALRSLITRAGANATPEMYVALGIHFVESGNQPKATETFAEAVRLQSDATRNADAAIADYYFQKFQWEKALGHLERLAEAVAKKPTTGLSQAEIGKRRELNLRLAETYSRVGKFDQAKAALTAALDAGPRDLIIDQLDGSISEARGTALLAAGKVQEALKAFDEGLASLANAAKSAPYNPTIAVQQASLHSKKFEATGDRAALTAGMAAADRGTRMRGDYWPAAQAKAELLIADGKRAEAVVELERFTKAAPSNAEGRRRLISLLAGVGNANRAIEVAREAIQLTPNDPQWREALAETYLASNQLDSAIVAYEQADKLRPSPDYLSRLTDLRMRQPKPDWGKLLAALREREDTVKQSPYLQSAIGAALANTGDMKSGLEVFRSSYRNAKDAVAAGRANDSIIDMWFTNLRMIYPVSRTADAEKFLYEISDNKPTTRDLRWLAEMWFAAGPDGASRAIEVAEKALGSNDGKDKQVTARLYDIIGGIRYGEGDCKAALAAFTKAAETLPDEAAVLNNLAYLAGECGDAKTGIAAAEKAVRIAPGQAEYLDTLGFVQGRAGDREKAVATLQEALRIQPSASANFHLAQVLLEMGRKEDAMTHARAAGDLKPDPAMQKQINALIEKLR